MKKRVTYRVNFHIDILIKISNIYIGAFILFNQVLQSVWETWFCIHLCTCNILIHNRIYVQRSVGLKDGIVSS